MVPRLKKDPFFKIVESLGQTTLRTTAVHRIVGDMATRPRPKKA